MNRFKEASTYAGIALIFQGIAQLLASKGTDLTALASIGGGLMAAFIREKAK